MKTVVVFPGQGSQFVGMGSDFYENFDSYRNFCNSLTETLGFDLSDIMLNGPDDKLRSTQYTQPALVAMSCGIYELLKNNVSPYAFAGHSLGEYSAIAAAGGFSYADAVKAVNFRGKAMQKAVPEGIGTMSAIIGLDSDAIKEAAKKISTDESVVNVANYNSPVQSVVSGHVDAVNALGEACKELGAKKVVPLSVSAPFHSSLMEPARLEMKEYLEKITIEDISTPVLNNCFVEYEKSASDIKNALVEQMTGPVRWVETIQRFANEGVDTIIEVGAGKVLTGLAAKINREIKTINISTVDDLAKI